MSRLYFFHGYIVKAYNFGSGCPQDVKKVSVTEAA